MAEKQTKSQATVKKPAAKTAADKSSATKSAAVKSATAKPVTKTTATNKTEPSKTTKSATANKSAATKQAATKSATAKPVAAKSTTPKATAVKTAQPSKQKAAVKKSAPSKEAENKTAGKFGNRPVVNQEAKASNTETVAKFGNRPVTNKATETVTGAEVAASEYAVASETPVDKSQKIAKTKKKKTASGVDGGSSSGGALATFMSNKKLRNTVISVVAVLLVVIIILSSVLGARSCTSNDLPFVSYEKSNTTVAVNSAPASEITGGYEKGYSKAPQTAKYIGAVEPVKPVAGVKDEHETYGVSEYPTWGKNLTGYAGSELLGIIQESRALTPYPTWKSANIYDAIDSEGYLLRNGERVKYENASDGGVDNDDEDDGIVSNPDEDLGEAPEETGTGSASVNSQYNGTKGYRMLYKHSAADSMYGGGLLDSEPRIIKEITYLTRTGLASNQITGLYAPAGEVIKVEISEEDLAAAGGSLVVYIGQNYNLDQQVSMEWNGSGDAARVKGSGLSRMSDILSKFVVSSPVSYVGSFIGGPIYIRPNSNSAERNITVRISGGVKYQHFILGATTEDEYEYNAQSSAPYFDLEVYDKAVRFTTTKYATSGGLALKDYTYENCTDAAILWDKISQVSKRVGPNGLSSSNVPVMIIGDTYIAAGAAFANPGRNGVVCPPNWLAEALNYNNFVNSGCWGTMHEYNHCWQSYGVGNGGEVTNNATTLVAYSLYTRISQSRTAAVSWNNGGWNRFTDPAKSLGELLTITHDGTTKSFDLSLYATLLHNIGQDNFIEAANGGRESGSTVYYNKLVEATHYDMTYYFTDVLNHNIDEVNGKGTLARASVEAVSQKNYPMFVPVASVYQVGRSIVYDGETQYVTTAQPFSYGYGEFTMNFNNRNNFGAGSFVSKELVIPDGITARVVSVTQPENGRVELLADNYVKYTPASGKNGLYSGNFIVKLQLTKSDSAFAIDDVDLVINLKQSSGTELPRTTYVYDDATAVPDTATVYNSATNTFNFGNYSATESKNNVCSQFTNTQIWQSGWNYDDDAYNKDSANYRVMPTNQTLQVLDGVMYFSKAGTYRFTLAGRGKSTLYLSFDDGLTWVNALTIERSSGTNYIATEYYERTFAQDSNYVAFKVVHSVKAVNNFFSVGVAAKKDDGTFTYAHASAFLNVDVHKALQEESATKFQTEYRYKTEYRYTYTDTETVPATQNSLVSVSHNPWDTTKVIDNLFDGKEDTCYHSAKNVFITDVNPFELVVDLGSTQKVNTVTFKGYTGNIGNNGMVKSFKIYGSLDGKSYFQVAEQTNSAANQRNMTFSFDDVEMRYYKLVVTKTDNGKYFAMNQIEFAYKLTYSNGIHLSPNDDSIRYTGDKWGFENVLANFGHIYQAKAGDSVEFRFTGTRCAYFAYQSSSYGTVDIYIDGILVAENVDLSADKNVGSLAYMYLGKDLEKTSHVMKVVGKSGNFNVDSFVYWE